MEQYKKQYGESHAYRLGNAYAQYPWVNPQITASLVLTDNDDLMPKVAEYAAARMAQTGVTPADISLNDSLSRKVQENVMSSHLATDPNGDSMLDLLAQSLKAARES